MSDSADRAFRAGFIQGYLRKTAQGAEDELQEHSPLNAGDIVAGFGEHIAEEAGGDDIGSGARRSAESKVRSIVRKGQAEFQDPAKNVKRINTILRKLQNAAQNSGLADAAKDTYERVKSDFSQLTATPKSNDPDHPSNVPTGDDAPWRKTDKK